MQGREAEMIPRMAPLRRVAWPKRVVWKQDDVTHTRFYWLERPTDAVKEREDPDTVATALLPVSW
jgi:hypothetical protein